MIEFFLVIVEHPNSGWSDLGNGNYDSIRGAKQGVRRAWRWMPKASRCRVLKLVIDPETGKTDSAIFAEYPRPE